MYTGGLLDNNRGYTTRDAATQQCSNNASSEAVIDPDTGLDKTLARTAMFVARVFSRCTYLLQWLSLVSLSLSLVSRI